MEPSSDRPVARALVAWFQRRTPDVRIPAVVASALAVALLVTALTPASPLMPAAAQAPKTGVAAAGSTVVDDLQGGFTPTGPGWRDGSGGYAGHHYWTLASRKRSLVGVWRATLDEPGRYKVLASVPPRHATSRRVVYKILTADGWVTRVGSQWRWRGKWLSLGIHDLARRAEVRLTDRTRDPRGTRRTLAFDAVKFVPRDTPTPSPTPSPAPSPSPTPPPSPSPSPTPSASPTLTPAAPVIRNIDVDPARSRAVVTFSLDAPGPARSEYRREGDSDWLVGAEETSSRYADHRQVITGLAPETSYELRIVAWNSAGDTVSDTVLFTTE